MGILDRLQGRSGGRIQVFFLSDVSRTTRDEQVAEVEIGGSPTSSHPFAQVDWRLEAVLDRRLWDDKSVETPLIVV